VLSGTLARMYIKIKNPKAVPELPMDAGIPILKIFFIFSFSGFK